MATKKKLLQAAAGTAAASGGAGGLNVEQVFSTYLYEGNGSAQVIENGINLGQSNDGGSAQLDGTNYVTASSGYLTSIGTGDFTIEGWWYFKDFTARTYFTRCWSFGTGLSDDVTLNVNTSGELQYRNNDAAKIAGSTTISTNTWYHIALCRSSGTTTLYLDGTSIGSVSNSVNFSTVANNSFYVGAEAGGGGGYANGYVSNIRIVNGTAVYTSSFTPSTSALTAISGTSLLTLQGDSPFVDNSSSALTITQNGDPKASSFGPFDAADAGEGGLVWIKSRSQAFDHVLTDTERGATKYLSSNTTNSTYTSSSALSSFNANGFSVGSTGDFNYSGDDFASWTFRKAPKFFTCVQYTGTGSSLTINHDLGVEPAVIIIKRTNTTGNWIVFTDVVDGTMDYLYLNDTSASADGSTLLSKSSTSFTLLQSFLYGNASGSEYVAYLFAHNDGDGDFGPTGDQDIIKCGSYTGTNADSNTVDLGFEPQWILWKSSTSAEEWHLVDNMRGWLTDDAGTDYRYLRANAANAESGGFGINITSTGFEANGSGAETNASGQTYIYIAIRRGPMAVPTDATDVFAIDGNPYATQDVPTAVSSFDTVDFALLKKDTAVGDWFAADRLRQGQTLYTNKTDAEAANIYNQFDYMYGWNNYVTTPISYISYMWKRAPSFCDVVAFTSATSGATTVDHNLGVAPDMIWVKRRDSGTANWRVYHSGLSDPNNQLLRLNGTNAVATSTGKWSTSDTTFSINDDNSSPFIAYLFASLDGVSKVGSFTMAGSDINVDCGFSSSARFVLLKRTDSISNWLVFDSERGIVAGADSLLLLNTTDAENPFGALDLIDPYSSGFTAVSANIANGDWIFYAIA